MIKLNSNKGREIISDYITALNGDAESIKWAYDRRKAEYDTYDDELKDSVDKCFDCIYSYLYYFISFLQELLHLEIEYQ